MLRKLCMIAAAVVIPVSVIAASGGTVEAAKVVPPVDATNYTVSCTVFSGGLKFKPALRSDFSLITAKVKATLAGCTAKPNGSGTPVDITLGKLSGVLTINPATYTDCAIWGIGGTYSANGALSVKWKTAAGTPKLSSGTTTVLPGSVLTGVTGEGGLETLALPGASGGIGGTGSFEGTDGGASDSFSLWGEDASTVFNQCYSLPGLHMISYFNATGSLLTLG